MRKRLIELELIARLSQKMGEAHIKQIRPYNDYAERFYITIEGKLEPVRPEKYWSWFCRFGLLDILSIAGFNLQEIEPSDNGMLTILVEKASKPDQIQQKKNVQIKEATT